MLALDYELVGKGVLCYPSVRAGQVGDEVRVGVPSPGGRRGW